MSAAKNILKACIVTGARSEYGLLYRLMKELQAADGVQLQIIVTGMHLMEKFGMTVNNVIADGWKIDARVDLGLTDDSSLGTIHAISRGTAGFADAFDRLKPDVVIVMGDRFELLSIVPTCLMMGIPVAHISGGEVTEGAFDDQIRHAVTKMASLHFTANGVFSKRVRLMGEEDWRVHAVGEPGLDYIVHAEKMGREELEKSLGLSFSKPTALVTLHPTTHELSDLPKQMADVAAAFKKFDLQYVITYPNADPGHEIVIDAWKKLALELPGKVFLAPNLGQKKYISSLQFISLMIGNTSSGIVESPSFGLPVVNIGDRQKGRIYAENVLSVPFDRVRIEGAIQKALGLKRLKIDNPYGDGNSSKKIVSILKRVFSERSKTDILKKKFIDHA